MLVKCRLNYQRLKRVVCQIFRKMKPFKFYEPNNMNQLHNWNIYTHTYITDTSVCANMEEVEADIATGSSHHGRV